MEVRSEQITGGAYISVGPGNFLMLIDTVAPVDVEFIKNGAVVRKAVNVESSYKGFPRSGEQFSGNWFDKAKISSATTQTVKFGVSDGAGDYGRLVGDVAAAPKLTQLASNPIGYDALSANNFAFFGDGQQAGVAAQYAHVQLLNPAGSGKVVFIDSIDVSAATAGATTLVIASYDVALATAIGAGFSKNMGGAASSALLKKESNAAQLGTQLFSAVAIDSRSQTISFQVPIRVPAGKGVLFRLTTVNVTINAAFQYREYA